jgi:hypothetical protein
MDFACTPKTAPQILLAFDVGEFLKEVIGKSNFQPY